jgi:hypothetical protein
VPRGQALKLTIVDANGQLVRELDAATRAGINRVTWDLRLAPPYVPERPPGGGGGGGGGGPFGGAPRGPFVLPGSYTARLHLAAAKDGTPVTQETALTVKADPLVRLTDEEARALHQARLEASRTQAAVYAAIRTAELIKAQVDDARRAIAPLTVAETLTKEAAALQREIDDVLDKVRGRGGPAGGGDDDDGPPRQPSIQQRVNRVANEIGGVSSPPTAIQRDTLAGASAELDKEAARINTLLTTRLPALHKMLDEANVPWTAGRTIK